MHRRVLIIGGSGYVGQEVCRQALERGYDTYTLNRVMPAENPLSGLQWLQGDITRKESVSAAINGRAFDEIHHVASLPGDTGNPAEMIEVNVLGLTNILDYARLHGKPRVVISSSISAYEWYPATKFSPPDYQPVDEEHPCRPRDMYSVSKRMQELLAQTFFHQYGLETVALRLTAVVGPNGRGGGRGWREFAEHLAEGKSVQIPHFSLKEVCHYIDSRDVAGLHLTCGSHPAAAGQIFNCCGPAAVSGHEFAAAIEQHFPGILVETGFPWSMAQGGVIAFSMEKAASLLGFTPKYSIDDSVAAIKAWIDGGGLTAGRSAQDALYGTGVAHK